MTTEISRPHEVFGESWLPQAFVRKDAGTKTDRACVLAVAEENLLKNRRAG